jgi:hypothetical protein
MLADSRQSADRAFVPRAIRDYSTEPQDSVSDRKRMIVMIKPTDRNANLKTVDS